MNRLARLAGTTALALSLGGVLAVAQTPENHLAHHPGAGTASGQGETGMPGAMPENTQPGAAMGMPGGMGGRGPGAAMGMHGAMSGHGPTAAAMPMMMPMMQMIGQMGGMMTNQAAMSGMGMMRFDHIAGRIAFLKAELAITETQEQTWAGFASALQAAAAKVEPMQTKMTPAMVNGTASMPERLQAEASLLDARAAAMHDIVHAARQLYAVLTPAQRSKADALVAGPLGMM